MVRVVLRPPDDVGREDAGAASAAFGAEGPESRVRFESLFNSFSERSLRLILIWVIAEGRCNSPYLLQL